jgi:hypothetical protein
MSSVAHRAFRRSTRAILLASLGALAATASAQAPPPSGFPGIAPEGPDAEILSFEAVPRRIEPGQAATLRWAGVNAYSVSIAPGLGAMPIRGSRTVMPEATTTYTLTITGPDGAETASVTVEVAGTAARRAAPAASAAPTVPRLADGRPDLSGVFLGGRDIHLAGDIELAAGGERFRVEPRQEDLGPGAECLPPGVPAATMVPYPLQIVHKPDVLVILYEAYNLFRIVPIGVPQPEEIDSTWMGHSVGRWDGDTLVVDVVGFNDRTRVAGYRHTSAMHVVERFRRTEYGKIEYVATVTDPAVFASPVVYEGDLILHPEWEIGEYICAENNKDYTELFEN